MVDELEEKLVNIENKLDGEEVCPVEVEDKLGWHLDYIESLIDGGSGGAAKVWSVEDDTNMDTFASSLKPGDMFNDGYSICIVGVVDTQNRRMVYLNVTNDNNTSYNDIYWYEGDTWLDTNVNVSKIFAGPETGAEGIANIWDVTAEMFDSLESYNESMKVGDIIVDRDEHLVGIIEYIEFTNHELSGLSIMYNHGQAGVGEIYFDAGDNEIKWVQQKVGTKLYKHTITIAEYTNIEIISTLSESITRLDDSKLSSALKIEWKAGGAYSGYQIYNYGVKYTGGGSYDGFVLYFVKSTNDGTDVTNTYKFYTHDNSNVTDNVTPL